MGAVSVIRWLLACMAVSMLMKPVFEFRGLRFPDEGFSIGLALGTAVSFIPVFWICMLFGCPFNSLSCIACLTAVSLIFCIVRKKTKSTGGMTVDSQAGGAELSGRDLRVKRRLRFLTGFGAFAILFLIAVWVKGFKPPIDFQTEQYMDFGFMNAMYRQQRLPFEDIWCAGSTVNYYYLGQAAAVFLCRLSGVTPEYGYNFMLCTLFASLAMTVYTLAAALLRSFRGMGRAGAMTGGIAASLICVLGGNGHWIVYGILQQLYYKLKGIVPARKYWFSDSTLFIGYFPDSPDKAKHEFPSYTLVLGDLHAHACNMMFTIPLLAVLFDYALCDNERIGYNTVRKNESGMRGWPAELTKRVLSPHVLMAGVLLGLFKGVNYWDFPIYYVVAGAVILFTDLKRDGMRPLTIAGVLLKGAVILALSALVILPFSMDYVKPVEGIRFADNYSPLYKLVIIWFAHACMALALIVVLLCRRLRELTAAELAMIAVTLCGLGLLLMPEIVYVKDIYGDEYQRYNTMFKLTFQGFILLSLSAGVSTGVLLNRGLRALKDNDKRGLPVLICSCLFGVLTLMLAAYMGWSVKTWFGDILRAEKRRGISAVSFIETDPLYDNLREAIEILNKDERRTLHIIEEAGNSYSPENRLSVFTGACTISGWYVHEWVWHNDSAAVYERHKEVENFYTCGYEAYCRALVKKYNVDYIYVGPKVKEKYAVNYNGFTALGEHVWESADGRYMLIKVYDRL